MTDVTVDFLTQLGDDLRLAAARETVRRSGARERAGIRPARAGRRPRWIAVTAAAAGFLILAGAVGTIATRDSGLSGDSAAVSVPQPLQTKLEEGLGAGDAPRVGNTSGESALSVDAGDQAGAGGNALGEETVPGAPGVPGEFTKVIKTSDLALEVERDAFDEQFQRATKIATDLDGFVTSSSAGVRSGSLVIRVPARNFDQAREQLKGLAITVERDSIQGQDVTAEFVDLNARLEILVARKTALVGLLKEASSLDEILRLQNAVDDVLIRIEELKGRVKLINDQTSKATISLFMHEEGVVAKDEDTPSITDAWSDALDGFLSVVGAIVIGIGYLLPLLALAAIGWLVFRAVRRRNAPTAE